MITDLYKWTDPSTKEHRPMVSEETFKIVMDNMEKLNSAIVYDRDLGFTWVAALGC